SIYPVDLLRAASRRIASRRDAGSAQEEGAAAKVDADFDMLLEDLTDFLNSNEYLKAFLQDSLRRSRTLIGEMKNAVEDDTVKKLSREVELLRQSCDDARSKVEKLNRLRQIQWRDHVQGLVPWLLERVGRLSTHVKAETHDPIARAIEEWFQSTDSLHELLDRNLLPTFVAAHSRLTEDAEEALKRRVSEDVSGLTATEDLLADLQAVGLDMRETAAAALDGLKANATVESPAPILSSEQIPVRRSVGDWLLMRSGAAVRRRLFGPAERPDAEIEVELKDTRLGEPARDAIRDAAMAQFDAMMDKLAEALPEQLVRGYAERFEVDIAERLEKAGAAAEQRLEQLGQRLKVMQQAHDRLRSLNEKLGS